MSQQLLSNFSPSILQVVLQQKVVSAKNDAMATPGEKFKRLRLRKGFGQSGLAAAIGLKTAQTISNFEIGKSEKMYLDNWRKVAEVFGMSVEDLNEAVFSNDEPNRITPADDHALLDDGKNQVVVPLDDAGKAYVEGYHKSGQSVRDWYEANRLDNNVQPAPKQAPPIPEWEAEIACGHWVECTTAALDPKTQMNVIANGRFIVRCMGDSMTPEYQPGARVMFRIVRLDEESLKVGADYYVQDCDGRCTLKTLKEIREDEYVLAPRNPKYEPLRVPKQLVVRWAIVETIVRAPWNGED